MTRKQGVERAVGTEELQGETLGKRVFVLKAASRSCGSKTWRRACGSIWTVLGFENAEWGSAEFTSVSRDQAAIYLCRGDQGRGGAWVWIGVEDVEKLHEEYKARGATIRLPPTNYPWVLEMQVEDPDGNVLRFGSERL